jgi:hypothetical protein
MALLIIASVGLLIAQSGTGLTQMTVVEQALADKIKTAMNGRKTRMGAG